VRGFWPIFKRELFAMFVTPLAWVLFTTFLLVQGIHIVLLLSQSVSQVDAGGGPLQAFFGGTILFYLVLLIVTPLLTMRLFAEERRSGTIETLLTAPVDAAGVVLGKYAAAFVTYAIMWVPTLLYVVRLSQFSDIDPRVVATSYAGVLAVGAGYLAIGTMTSAMTTSQVTAAVLSSTAVVGLFMLGIGGEFVFDTGTLHDVCSYMSVWAQLADFSQGVVDLRRIAFDVGVTAVPLFVTVRAVESWGWG
jgi:ABC-2 type transport system permease protein